jgi:hypothetical protein
VATAKKTVSAKATAPQAPARKATAKAPAKAPAKTPAKAATKPAPAPKPVKVEKPKKPKLVRDSFTIPKAEYTVLDDLKQRAAKLGAPAKKSEVLRAGIKALAQMSDAAFQSAMAAVPAIKTGRPGKAD